MNTTNDVKQGCAMVFIFLIPEFLLILPVIVMLLSAITAVGSVWAVFDLILKYFWVVVLGCILKAIVEIALYSRKEVDKKCNAKIIILNCLQCAAIISYSYKMVLSREDHPIIMAFSSLYIAIIFFFGVVNSIFAALDKKASARTNLDMIEGFSIAYALVLISCVFPVGWMLVFQLAAVAMFYLATLL